ncbi:tRNA (guanosine(37)-N1)-methyltransferase TrmD [Candidatus Gottesmanbacteria bacterium]|nr:tRNA (guanosine(37)-N1)-methyltransferase TrmD [Candidatus Gottesmanbacteria bacterium]
MRISILTLFTEMFSGPFDYSIIKRAKQNNAVTIDIVNIRDFAKDSYKSVDNHPYGGGVGMVLKVDIIDKALSNVKCQKSNVKCKEYVILLDPRGTPFTQAKARELTKFDHLILVCGHYEGVDERVTSLVNESVSIGEYILTGGEIPAMAVADAVVRLLPNVLKKEATLSESFSLPNSSSSDLPILEYPQYTRPEVYKGMKVPEVLLGGNHKKIEEWRLKMSSSGLTRGSSSSYSGSLQVR